MRPLRASIMAFATVLMVIISATLPSASSAPEDDVKTAREKFGLCIVNSTASLLALNQLTEIGVADMVGFACSQSRQSYADALKSAGYPDYLMNEVDNRAVAYILSKYQSH